MQVEFQYKDRKFSIATFPIGNSGQWGCSIYPYGSSRGLALFEPDAVFAQGKLVGLASEEEAIEAGRSYVRSEFLRD